MPSGVASSDDIGVEKGLSELWFLTCSCVDGSARIISSIGLVDEHRRVARVKASIENLHIHPHTQIHTYTLDDSRRQESSIPCCVICMRQKFEWEDHVMCWFVVLSLQPHTHMHKSLLFPCIFFLRTCQGCHYFWVAAFAKALWKWLHSIVVDRHFLQSLCATDGPALPPLAGKDFALQRAGHNTLTAIMRLGR